MNQQESLSCLQGDVLSGTLAVMVAWAQEAKPVALEGVTPLMVAAYGASMVARLAQKRAFQKMGRSMLAGDVIEELGPALDQVMQQEEATE